MKVKKRLNNNAVFAVKEGQEVIVIGKGIGFQIYPGHEIDEKLVERIFVPTAGMTLMDIALLLDEIPLKDIEMTEKIIKIGEDILGKAINPSIFLPLMDHISFAIKRFGEGINIVSPLSREVKQFYPNEVKVGYEAIELIKEKYDICLSSGEAVAIALHFINAQYSEGSISLTVKFTEIIAVIVQIVKQHFDLEIDEDSFAYNRFITHLRYYLARRENGEIMEVSNHELCESVMKNLPEEVACMELITDYLYNEHGWETPEEEKMYLVLHINYIVSRAKQKTI